MSKSEKQYSMKLKYSVIIIALFLFQFFTSFVMAQNDEFETFNLNTKVDKVGWNEFVSLYKESGELYLPLVQLFEYLKINIEEKQSGAVVEGFFIDSKTNYRIDTSTRQFTLGQKTIGITENDFLVSQGELYISSVFIKQQFGIETNFDFRSLSANISAPFELPATRLMKLETARKGIKNLTQEVVYDKEYPRQYHFFKPGMLDWSFTLNQSKVYTNENRFGLALGSEFLFGELSVWMYYSDRYGFNRNQQRYYWRWVDNNFKPIRQVQIGRIYNKSIATLLYPVDGFMITNAPTTIRKAKGTYQISETTNPDWTVELYINNVLVDYTKADASGYFSFQVPNVYGTSELTLRYYGPNGEEQSERKTIHSPYNMLPAGEFEYRVSGGVLLNGLNSYYGRAETSLGIARWLTAGAGYEYLSTINSNPHIPFGNLTIQPFSGLVISGEYAHKVRYKGTLNLNFLRNSMLELNYSYYEKDQKAIIYNFKEERIAALTLPMRLKNVSAVAKATFRQNMYPNFEFNSGDLMLTAYYKNFNANLTNYINWTDFQNKNIYSNLALGLRLNGGFSIRPSVQYNFTGNADNWYDNFISYKAELEKQIFKRGYITLGYERNNLVDYEAINMAIRYDFNFMSAYTSAYYANGSFETAQSARGSLAFGGGNGYVHFDSRDAVGRSAISIAPFVDKNFNGKRDDDEPAAQNLTVRCSGGKVLHRKNDSIARVVGLEPFVDYNLTFDETEFKNIAWRIDAKNVKVTTDPNQFKTIEVPVKPMGEMSGTVVDENNKGIARILINIDAENGQTERTVMSESDGFFSFLGLKPGNYTAKVDPKQLDALRMKANELSFQIKEDLNGDITDAGKIKLTYVSEKDSLEQNSELNKAAMKGLSSTSDSLQMLKRLNKFSDKNNPSPDILQKYDSLLKYIILFDFNSARVRSEFYGTIKQLGKLLQENPMLKLEIQGHTDNVGSDDVNIKFSERRANSVRKILVKYGIDESRLRIVGFGKRLPVPGNTNSTPKERSQNRRVVFKAISDKDVALIDSISRKNPDDITEKDARLLRRSVSYVTDSDPFAVKWRFSYSFLFHYASYKVRPEQKMLAKALAGIMKDNTCLVLYLTSHTDLESSEERNMQLSIKRAQSVWDELAYEGIERTRVEVANYGENKPFNANSNSAEKALNRRVTIGVHPTGCQMNIDSLLTEKIKQTYKTRISNQIIINHDNKFMIQTGAFSLEQNAILMALKLKDFVPDNIYIVPDNGLYRVIVGYTETRKEAMDIARVIQASGILANPYNY